MREQTITWYTPEEKLPEQGTEILFKVHSGYSHINIVHGFYNIIYNGEWFIDYYDDFNYNKNEIKEWCYIDKL